MQAHGGLLSVARAMERPVGMIECGPVSGLMGCKRLGELLGVDNIISADMGGTTFKVGVVRGGRIEYQHESQVFRYHYALPKVDIVSLGLAGGSIISFDERTGTPEIGPRSAGSYPGPIVYGHGGTECTVTDVDAILGFMNESYFLGGRERLDVARAHEVFEETVAAKLGLDVLEAAGAIYKLANVYIYDLLHRTTVQRGLDPRSFVLFSTGGTAGMHLPILGNELGVQRVVIPYSASVHGAFGLITSDVVHEELLTRPMRQPGDSAEIDGIFRMLEARVGKQLRDDGFAAGDVTILRSVDMHYRRQVHEVTVPVATRGPVTEEALDRLIHDFTLIYQERYGEQSTWEDAAVEFVTFRVRGSGSFERPSLHEWAEVRGSEEGAIVESRDVFLPPEGIVVRMLGYDLERLAVGAVVRGPALIWSPITTIVLARDQVARVDSYRNLVIELSAGG